MRAFAIDQFGAAGAIHELPLPEPGDGQVQVRVEAASINPADNLINGGAYKDFMEHRFPLVPGLDMGGTVDALGSGVRGLQVGDHVFGAHGKMIAGAGTYAEYTVASIATLARRPAGIDAPFGAALSLAGVSALQMVDEAELRADDVVLVIGASGGIGSIALQLAAAAGAKAIAVCRVVNHDYVRGLGAAETIDYPTQDVFETVSAAHPEGLAAIFDMVGDREANGRLAELVHRGGHVISMVGAADAEALASRGINGLNVIAQVATDKLERLAGFVAAGTLRRPEIRTIPLAEAGAGLAEVAGRHVRGKLVVVP